MFFASTSIIALRVNLEDRKQPNSEDVCSRHNEMTAWAGGTPMSGRTGFYRSELLTALYGVPSNPVKNVQSGPGCGKDFPWSITQQQLVQWVDPMIERAIVEERPMVVIEIGVLYGGTSISIAERIHSHLTQDSLLRENSTVISVDTWLGDMAMWNNRDFQKQVHAQGGAVYDEYNCYAQNVQLSVAQDMIVPLRLPSSIAARLLYQKGVLADLIYVDGSHDFEDVLGDLNRFKYLLTSCGQLFGDDFHLDSVKSAVVVFANQNNLRIEKIAMRSHSGADQVGWALRSSQGC